MRHRKRTLKLSKTSSHRKAMFSNMCNSLIEYEVIRTTLPKAKALRSFIEPMITSAKTDNLHNRRKAFATLRSGKSVGKLFLELGPRYEARPGGYTRVLKCGYRTGDKAPMAFVEFVDRPTFETAILAEDEANATDETPTTTAIEDQSTETNKS